MKAGNIGVARILVCNIPLLTTCLYITQIDQAAAAEPNNQSVLTARMQIYMESERVSTSLMSKGIYQGCS